MNISRLARLSIGIHVAGYGFLIQPYRTGITEALYIVFQPDVASFIAQLVGMILFLSGGIIIGDALFRDNPSRMSYYALSMYFVWVVLSINAGIHYNNIRVIWTVLGAFIHMFFMLNMSHKLGELHGRNTAKLRRSHRHYLTRRWDIVFETLAKSEEKS